MICFLHFKESDFYITNIGRQWLHKHAVPSIFQNIKIFDKATSSCPLPELVLDVTGPSTSIASYQSPPRASTPLNISFSDLHSVLHTPKKVKLKKQLISKTKLCNITLANLKKCKR